MSDNAIPVLPEAARLVPGFPGYCVDPSGAVWTRVVIGRKAHLGGEWRRLAGRTSGAAGYRIVTLSCEGGPRKRYVHRLVLEAFVGPCPPGMECCHADGDRTNNGLDNLRWDTRKSNKQDSIAHGTVARGQRNGRARLRADDVRRIRSLCADGRPPGEVAAAFGVSSGHVSDIIHQRKWRHL